MTTPTFTYSEVPVGWFESFFGWFAGQAEARLSDDRLKFLLISGVIDGVGGVMGFVPLILFMFLGIAFLEDSGYLVRLGFYSFGRGFWGERGKNGKVAGFRYGWRGRRLHWPPVFQEHPARGGLWLQLRRV